MDDMSLFVLGYQMGKKRGGGDPRVKKLEAAPTLWRFDIAEGWNVRVKIASDVDNMQYYSFGITHGGIVDNITQWSIYYCVYLNDDLKFASCDTAFRTKHHENYQNSDVPNRLYVVYDYSDLLVTSGKMTFNRGGSSFLSIEVAGTYILNQTPYSWDADENRIKGETTTSMGTFNHSKNDFGGSQYKGSYIVNGGAEDFKNAVFGLYSVCRGLAI